MIVSRGRSPSARDRQEAAFRHGNASEIPFPDASFDFVVCTAAFKNFSDPVGGLNEIHRVLAPGGHASIIDLRKDASRDDIATQVRGMHLSTIDALVTRWTFRFFLLKRAYRRAAREAVVMASRFGAREIPLNTHPAACSGVSSTRMHRHIFDSDSVT